MNAPAPADTSRPSFPGARVSPNAAHAFGGIWRLTARRFFSPTHWLVLAGMFGVLALLSWGAGPRTTEADRYIGWAGGFYVCFLVPLLAFISAAGAIRDDLKAGSIDYIFTRPVGRPAFVFFRYAAHVVCVQLEFLLALAVVIAMGLWRNLPEIWDAVPLLLLTQAVLILSFSAFGFLCGMLTSRYVIVGLLYGAIVEIGIGNVPTQLSRLSMVRQALGLLQPVMGDNDAAPAGPLVIEALGAPATIALLLGFSVAMLAVAAARFNFKELAGAADRGT